jgi:hypothetical protein
MKYRPLSFDSIDRVPHADWLRVCERSDARDFMRPAFIRAVEAGARSFAHFRHVLIYAGNDEPVACACLSLLTLDLAHVVSPVMSRLIRVVPRRLSGFSRPRIVICGLPVSFGQSSVAYTPDCDVKDVVLLLEQLASRFSEEESAQLIVFKEFDVHAAETMDVLRTRGYTRLESPPMNLFNTAFDSFDAYCSALRSPYRIEVRHSLRRLQRGGARTRVIVSADEILSTYTPAVHRLYLNVVERSAIKVEVLSIEFFQQLVRRFPGAVELILIEKEERILACAWTMTMGCNYYCLYLGQDYTCKSKLDLYFNLVYAALDSALRKHPSRIEFGQTADRFKARLGCRREKRFAYARGTGWFTRILCRFGDTLIVQVPEPQKFDIYRAEAKRPMRERDQECTTSS